MDRERGRDGSNGKAGKQTRAHAAVQPQGESGEDSGVMGMLKRKRTSPPESPAPSKKPVSEESSGPLWSSSHNEVVEGTAAAAVQGNAGKSRASPGDSRLTKQYLAPGHEESMPVDMVAAEEAVVRSGPEKDPDDPKTKVVASVENVSHGQGASFQAQRSPETSSGAAVVPSVEISAGSQEIVHRIPTHAGWFQWTKIHQLERLGLPEFFSGKNNQKTPEIFMENRNRIIIKYRENPKKLIKLEDVQGLVGSDDSGHGRLFGFLDHWGLINYQAIADFSPFSSSQRPLGSVEETPSGALQVNPLTKPHLSNLFQFEAALAPAPKLVSAPTGPASNLPLSSLADAVVQESLAAPSVEYHCNSCQADCSKRRYHCQKQADFDLCPECYGDGKFGQGMTATDFLRMDALTENADANGGGWSDQETLLLLEALELYGDNWNEIAEHVATKSKSQCILHFIRLPIEDSFLEDMEAPTTGLEAQLPSSLATDTDVTKSANDKDESTETPKKLNSPSGEAKESSSLNPESDTPLPKHEEDREMRTAEKNTPAKTDTEENDHSACKSIETSKTEDLNSVLLAVAESAGCGGPDGLIAFADAGNPVMTQVAFLAAMVGPCVAAAAAQAALKSLAEDDPVGFLSARNSFVLDCPGKEDIIVPGSAERLTDQQSAQVQSVDSSGVPTESSDSKAGLTTTEEGSDKELPAKVTGTVDSASGEGRALKPEQNILTTTSVEEQEVPSIAKVRNAAASALASAAVKAKLLADQEEREIQRLVAGVIENQLKKLELKLKHFNELEVMLRKESDQAEKARSKVYAERARIVASRLGSTSAASQMQSTGSSSAPSTKSSSHPSSFVGQPRPAVFTFGPSGVSAPVATHKTGPETSTSSPAGASSQQVGASQRPS